MYQLKIGDTVAVKRARDHVLKTKLKFEKFLYGDDAEYRRDTVEDIRYVWYLGFRKQYKLKIGGWYTEDQFLPIIKCYFKIEVKSD